MQSQEDIRNLFQRSGLRCTRQREQVYAALAATRTHPTAEELFHAVRGLDEALSLATVYNALDAFIQAGIARQVPAAGPARYDADMDSHVHLATPEGDVVDVPEDLSRRLLAGIPAEAVAELEARLGVKVSRVMLQVVLQGGEPERAKKES